MAPDICPSCGAEVPRRAKACPQCGACEQTGWSEVAETGGLDLPDEEFDYGEFVKQEFGGVKAKPRGLSRFWWVVAIAVLMLFVVALLHR